MTNPKQKFRDVTGIVQTLRNFFLGRKYTLHGRFPPLVSPRSIPPPDIPRGMDLKYSGQYYFKRHAFDSVKPPVVAPVAAIGKGSGSVSIFVTKFKKHFIKTKHLRQQVPNTCEVKKDSTRVLVKRPRLLALLGGGMVIVTTNVLQMSLSAPNPRTRQKALSIEVMEMTTKKVDN